MTNTNKETAMNGNEQVSQERFYEIFYGLSRLQVAFVRYKRHRTREAKTLFRRAARALMQEHGLGRALRVRRAQDFNGYIISVVSSEGIPFEVAITNTK